MPATVSPAVLLLLSLRYCSGLDPNPHNGGLGIQARKTWSQGGSIRRPSSASDRGYGPHSAAAGMRNTTMFHFKFRLYKLLEVQKLACRSSVGCADWGHRIVAIAKFVSSISNLALRGKEGMAVKVRRLGPGKTVQI